MVRMVALAVGSVLLGHSVAQAAPVCRVEGFPRWREAGVTHLVATPLPRMVAVPLVVERLPETSPARRDTTWLRDDPPALLAGQPARLERVGGDGAERIRASGSEEVVLVPWTYGPDCRHLPVGWSEEASWMAEREPGFFTAHLRAEADWVDGRPTLDVFRAWHHPYPYAPFIRPPRDLPASAPWLTLDEYWELYEALPDDEALDRDAERAIERLRGWERSNPGLAARFPAAEVLEGAYGHAAYRAGRARR
jgi:hypothetical protein